MLAPLEKAFTFELSAVGSPLTTVEYNYVAKLEIATVGLSPTRPTDSFAALTPNSPQIPHVPHLIQAAVSKMVSRGRGSCQSVRRWRKRKYILIKLRN